MSRAVQSTSDLPLEPHVVRATYIIWWISASTTSLVFFFRARAVFLDSRTIRWSFMGIWALILVAPVGSPWSSPHFCECLLYYFPTSSKSADDCLTEGHSEDPSSICNQWYPFSLFLYFAIICHDTLLVVCVYYRLRCTNMGSDIEITSPPTHIIKQLCQSDKLYYGCVTHH